MRVSHSRWSEKLKIDKAALSVHSVDISTISGGAALSIFVWICMLCATFSPSKISFFYYPSLSGGMEPRRKNKSFSVSFVISVVCLLDLSA